MAEIFGFETGISVTNATAQTFGTYLLGLGIIIVASLGIAFGIWYYYRTKLFNKQIVVFENISGQGWQVTMKDKARHLRLSKDGTEVLFLKKKKMPLTAYGKKMGLNTFWFAIGQDGGWYNFVLGDLDAKMGVLDIEPIDRDIKYISVALRRNAQDDYGADKTFMDKYGTWVMGAITMVIMFAGLSFLIAQMGDVAQILATSAKASAELNEPITRALAHVDAICSGGTGIVQA